MRGEVACGTPLGLPGFSLSLGAAAGPALSAPAAPAGSEPLGVGVCGGDVCPAGPPWAGGAGTQRPGLAASLRGGHGQSCGSPSCPRHSGVDGKRLRGLLSFWIDLWCCKTVLVLCEKLFYLHSAQQTLERQDTSSSFFV